MSTDFDEETWLVAPPKAAGVVQESGRLLEWLQGANDAVDFQTRSALSRRLASQAAKKKKRAERLREKALSLEPSLLCRVQEELSEFQLSGNDNDDMSVLSGSENDNGDNNMNERSPYGKDQRRPFMKSDSRFEVMNTISDDDENDEFYDASSDFGESQQIIERNKFLTGCRFETREKVANGTKHLPAVSERSENAATNESNRFVDVSPKPSNWQQSDTPRVSPYMQTSTPLSRTEQQAAKTHCLDLNDIRHIVERQETELWEELRRQSSAKNANLMVSPGTFVTPPAQSSRPASSLASSRSVDFSSTQKLSLANGQRAALTHGTRLPMPVKRMGRSMIPTPRPTVLSRSAVRGLAGGSTPSLAVPQHHLTEETRSECGGIAQWTDECF